MNSITYSIYTGIRLDRSGGRRLNLLM